MPNARQVSRQVCPLHDIEGEEADFDTNGPFALLVRNNLVYGCIWGNGSDQTLQLFVLQQSGLSGIDPFVVKKGVCNSLKGYSCCGMLLGSSLQDSPSLTSVREAHLQRSTATAPLNGEVWCQA